MEAGLGLRARVKATYSRGIFNKVLQYYGRIKSKATYQKSWLESKSSSDQLAFRHKVFNGHAIFLLVRLTEDTTGLQHSVFRVPTPCLN